MRIRVGLENKTDAGRRSLAWALDYPGCFAYGNDGASAIIAMGRAVPAYYAWLQIHTTEAWLPDVNYDIRLVETWDCYAIDAQFNRVQAGEGREINAWFFDDWKPLTAEEARRALQTLSWSRADLEAIIGQLTDEQLDRHPEGQRWPIRGVLNHIGGAEWYYLDRLGLAPCTAEELPQEYSLRLELVRSRLNQVLPELVGEGRVVGVDGEFWSSRKLVRRAIWHEIDHIRHILELLGAG